MQDSVCNTASCNAKLSWRKSGLHNSYALVLDCTAAKASELSSYFNSDTPHNATMIMNLILWNKNITKSDFDLESSENKLNIGSAQIERYSHRIEKYN